MIMIKLAQYFCLLLISIWLIGCSPELLKNSNADDGTTPTGSSKQLFSGTIEGAWVRYIEFSDYEIVLFTSEGLYAKGETWCEAECDNMDNHNLDYTYIGEEEIKPQYDISRFELGNLAAETVTLESYQIIFSDVNGDLTRVVSLRDNNGEDELLLGSTSDITEAGVFSKIEISTIPDIGDLANKFYGTWLEVTYDEYLNKNEYSASIFNENGTYVFHNYYCETSGCTGDEQDDYSDTGYWAVIDVKVDSSGLNFYTIGVFKMQLELNIPININFVEVYLSTSPTQICNTESFYESGVFDYCITKES